MRKGMGLPVVGLEGRNCNPEFASRAMNAISRPLPCPSGRNKSTKLTGVKQLNTFTEYLNDRRRVNRLAFFDPTDPWQLGLFEIIEQEDIVCAEYIEDAGC